MASTQDDMIAELQRANVALQLKFETSQAERDAALAREAALADVLNIINSSPGDPDPVFEAILAKAHLLCRADLGALYVYEDGAFRALATRGFPESYVVAARRPFPPTVRYQRLLDGERYIHVLDVRTEELQPGQEIARALRDSTGVRTWLTIPLRKDGDLLGVISAHRLVVRPFLESEIALLESFAAQAVIAMENARILGELRQRTSDVQESLEYQTATGDVLKVISRSTFDLQPVLDTVVQAAARLCDAEQAAVYRRDDQSIHLAVNFGFPPEYETYQTSRGTFPLDPGSPTVVVRAMLEGHPVHIHDVTAVPRYPDNAITLGKVRTSLGVPLLREGKAIGSIVLARQRVEPFTDRQIELVGTFADQAVIAMDNARLLGELRHRTADLQQSLEYQTATSDVLKVISQATFDIQPVFDTIVATAARLCEADAANIANRDGDGYRIVAAFSGSSDYGGEIGRVMPVNRQSVSGRAVLTGQVVQVENVAADPDYVLSDESRRMRLGTIISVPLLRDGAVVGTINLGRSGVRPYATAQIELVRTFADQALIAMENARLLGELRTALDTTQATLRELRVAQANLIQAEKMASLGQLTAGIAHEIKNPLNFINNFAVLCVDLLKELKDFLVKIAALLNDDQREELEDIIAILTANLEKITHHGKRADGIVMAMLEHSRGASGERREVDINQLTEEALNLAYHGARANDKDFNITLDRDFGDDIAPFELNPQDMTRVLLNMFNNGFYAASHRNENGEQPGFKPTLRVTTRAVGDTVEIRVRDNGTGIPAEIRDKLFQPFFTTKPSGQGTGLGLSIGYDIVTKQHGGTIAVDSEINEFTEFVVSLPRGMFASVGSPG